MAFTFTEDPASRDQVSGTADSASHMLIYKAAGEQDDFIVHQYAIANTPVTVVRPTGVLYRNQVRLHPEGFQLYRVEVSYAKLGRGTMPIGKVTFNFDTSGGTTHVRVAKKHVRSYGGFDGPESNFHKGAINVSQDGHVEGTDVVIPYLKFSLMFKFASGQVTLAYVKKLAAITGTTNSQRFLSFEPSELLFRGATGDDGTDVESTVRYDFEASQNASGLTFGDITGVDKAGWDYLWFEFKDEVVDGHPGTQPLFAHVERVYDQSDFGQVFGWNLFTGV